MRFFLRLFEQRNQNKISLANSINCHFESEIQILNYDHAIHFAISISRRNHSMDFQANPASIKVKDKECNSLFLESTRISNLDDISNISAEEVKISHEGQKEIKLPQSPEKIKEKNFLDVLKRTKVKETSSDSNATKPKRKKINHYFSPGTDSVSSTPSRSNKKQTFLSKTPAKASSILKLKDIKFYDAQEIKDPNLSFIEMQRREFWNSKASSIIKTPKYHNWTTHAITGLINSPWVLKKCSLGIQAL